MTDLTHELVTSVDAFDALAGDWWELWQSVPVATPFQTPAWLIAWWHAFAPGRLATFAVREAASRRLVGLAPLYAEASDRGSRLLPIGISASDYVDVLLAPGSEHAAGAALVEALDANGGWQRVELPDLAPEALARGLQAPENTTDETMAAAVCPAIVLPKGAGFDDVVPALQRRKLRMAQHRLDRHGHWRIHSTGDLEPARWADLVTDLHGRRWRARGETGVLADERMLRLISGAFPELATRGLLRCHALEIGVRIAGVFVGFAHRGVFYAWLGGLDPRFAEFSPGSVLIGKAIEAAIADEASRFDFLRGGEPYKYGWGAVDFHTYRRVFRRPA